MALPKRQHSKQRSRKRRTHYKVIMASMGKCPQCKKAIMSPRVCPSCGFYKGYPFVEIKIETEEKTQK